MLNQPTADALPTAGADSLVSPLSHVTPTAFRSHAPVVTTRPVPRVGPLPAINRLLASMGTRSGTRRSAAPFEACVLDHSPALMQESYRIRYQVYCLEREFLSERDYPEAIERDEYDGSAVHVGAIDRSGVLAGTARLVLPYDGTLPTMSECPTIPLPTPLWGRGSRWVEASRLSVSRSYGTESRPTGTAARHLHPSTGRSQDDRGLVFLTILKALYQTSRRVGATHWLVSIERSLQRLLSRHGFPFRQLGPQFEYLGPVAPYSLDLRELEQVMASGQYPALLDFRVSGDPDIRDRTRLKLKAVSGGAGYVSLAG